MVVRTLLTMAIGLMVFAGSALGADRAVGGKGKVDSLPWCTETGDATILSVCGNSTLYYELSSLMGEPITHYGIKWSVTSITVRTSAEEAPLSGEVIHADSPAFREVFKGSEQKIHLVAHGYATFKSQLQGDNVAGVELNAAGNAKLVFGKIDKSLAIEFDSGAPTGPGKVSWEIAGGSEWDKLIFDRPVGDCVAFNGKRFYRDKATAKNIWREGGISLTSFQSCNGDKAGFDVSNLGPATGAISRYCQAHPGKSMGLTCPKAEKEPQTAVGNGMDDGLDHSRKAVGKAVKHPWDLMDEVVDAPKIDKIRQDLVKAYERGASRDCDGEIKKIDACYVSQGCVDAGLPSDVTPERCDGIKPKPGTGFRGGLVLHRCPMGMDSCECLGYDSAECSSGCRDYPDSKVCRGFEQKRAQALAEKAEAERQASEAYSRALAQWESEWGALSSACQVYSQKKAVIKSCRAANQSVCNAENKSFDGCLSKKMLSAPTESDARIKYEQDVNQRAKQAGKVRHFLD